MLLEIVRYRSRAGYVPFDFYMEKYSFNPSDKKSIQDRKERIKEKILAIINIVAEKGGANVGEYTAALKGYKIQEIRLTCNSRAVRILYFCHSGKLFLLNGFDKAIPYEGGKKKKTQSMIEEKYCEGQRYYEDFINN
jgi:uncharacterized membrane protein YsdA (DUF1294 family)